MPGTDGEQMMVDPRLSELARRSPNFGFLLDHEPVLVGYGAAAEAMVFSDPNTSMMKARQFGEQLVSALLTSFGIRIPGQRPGQHKRLKVLLDQGVITARVHSWFDTVRDTGNKATHEDYEAQRDALRLVRTCYELGAWFHRTVTRSRDAPPFVPPQPAQPTAPPRDQADAAALTELTGQLNSYPEFCLVATVSGQYVLTAPSALYLDRVTWTDDVAAAWRPNDDPRSAVLIDPEVRFGRPSVSGISTEVFWEHVDSGEDTREVAEAFDLTVSDVQWALAYENAQRAA